MTAAFRFDSVLTPEGWLSPGYVSVGGHGLITRLSRDAPEGQIETLGGFAIPGIANVHSHAFQRSMAGLSEYRTAAVHDSFWTWRELMYRFVDRITPDDLEDVAAQLYLEMLKAGYTAVGEFQYIHHDRDGTPYADPAEMTLRTVEAAKRTGIGATFLPVLYQNGGFGGQPPAAGQRRFVTDTEQFLDIFRELRGICAIEANHRTGIAPHSLRAVEKSALREAAGSIDGDVPVHIHIAEQEKEVRDCEAWSGRRPVEWLLANMEVDDRWCLVHATHMTPEETRLAARTGAAAGLCPTTEANLGDGLFPLRPWLDAGGAFGVGSDSHVSVSPVEELRWLEYGQRLRDRKRNVAGETRMSTGTRLVTAAAVGGARCLGYKGGLLQVGLRADMVVLDGSSTLFAGQNPETLLDSWVFSGNVCAVTDVFVGGRRVIHDGRHVREEEISTRYRIAMERLLTE